MRPTALLAQARAAGIRVRLDGEMGLRLAYKADVEPALLAAIRHHKADIVEHLQADHMPAGFGRCPACREFTMLPAGPEDGICDTCALLLADEGEVTVRGELP